MGAGWVWPDMNEQAAQASKVRAVGPPGVDSLQVWANPLIPGVRGWVPASLLDPEGGVSLLGTGPNAALANKKGAGAASPRPLPIAPCPNLHKHHHFLPSRCSVNTAMAWPATSAPRCGHSLGQTLLQLWPVACGRVCVCVYASQWQWHLCPGQGPDGFACTRRAAILVGSPSPLPNPGSRHLPPKLSPAAQLQQQVPLGFTCTARGSTDACLQAIAEGPEAGGDDFAVLGGEERWGGWCCMKWGVHAWGVCCCSGWVGVGAQGSAARAGVAASRLIPRPSVPRQVGGMRCNAGALG